MERPPESKQVLLFKAPKEDTEGDPYVKTLGNAGFIATCLPVLGFNFTHLDELLAELHCPDAASGIILTSQRAVQAIQEALKQHNKQTVWEESLSATWKQKFCFCVGKATSKAASDMGFTPVGDDTGSAEALVPEIIKVVPSSSLPLVFPCGNLRRETIPGELSKAGLELKSITCYETNPNPDIENELRHHIQQKGTPDYVVFFSPSGVTNTKLSLEKLALASKGSKWVAIGSTSRQALETLGWTVAAEATSPTPEGLLQGLLEVAKS